MRRLPLKKYLSTGEHLLTNLRLGEAVYPFYASLKVTQRCRFRCAFCDVWHRPAPELSFEQIRRILDNLAHSSVILVSLEGGDPLLREDMGELLKYAHSLPFYLLFTTSERDLEAYPMAEYGRYIDFLHISIDEGHDNLEMLDQLDRFTGWGAAVCVQIVVMSRHLEALEQKVEKCHRAGAKALIMPAVHLDRTRNYFPDFKAFKAHGLALKRKYPHTVITPARYFTQMEQPQGCDTSSVIIDFDGGLFYPCKILGEKPASMLNGPFMDFLRSPAAKRGRRLMAQCGRRCGWYQYFATSSYVSPHTVFSALQPYLF